ncbi:MAG: putative lipid II flippase FtsW [Patescibacteria group bacterium]|jgi:cell division protein FtsW
MNSVRRKHSDYWLSLSVFALICFGLIMIYSVSKYYSLDVTDGATDKLYLKKQIFTVAIGLIAWIVMQAIDYRFWLKHAGKMFYATLGLLALPIILEPFGIARAGRWIDFLGFNFQPAELAKLTFIFYLAAWFAQKGENQKKIQESFWSFVGIVGIIAGFMLLEKDLGTLAIFVIISAGMFIMAGAPLSQIFSGGALAAALVWLAVKIEPYRMQRFLTFLNPENDSLSSGYHIKNALIAIGSGGLWGLGFGQSRQKYLYLPEAHTDSIFAIICEELGMVRASLIIVVFIFIAMRGLKIALRAPDIFSRLLAASITFWLFAQMAINISAMFSLVPLTGIPLPFISYGGTSVIILLSAVGVLSNISKHTTDR